MADQFERPVIQVPDDEIALADALGELDRQLEEEMSYWQQNQLPPAQMIYQMGPQEFDHHCHSEAFIELFRILGFSKEQLNLIYKTVALRELQGLRKIAKEARKESLRAAIVDGTGIIPPRPPQS